MRWTKFEQQEKYLDSLDHGDGSKQGGVLYRDQDDGSKQGGVLYKDHLVTLKDRLTSEKNAVCCLNLRILHFFHPFRAFLETKNSWKTFDIKGIDDFSPQSNGLMVYNGLLFTFVEDFRHDIAKYVLVLAVLNLESK